jgi:hypothetical protein
MKFLRHFTGQPFVIATGFAALVHSTWALGTLFSGVQPEGWHLVGWLIPALLIAFALDVGQIATSNEIRKHGLTVGRGVTFFVFAVATYYLQWLYIAHHMPALDIAAGVSATAKATAISMRDAALWVIPALLPLSTLLYTFSGEHERDEKPMQASQINIESPIVGLSNVQQNLTPALPENVIAKSRVEQSGGGFIATYGEWRKEYPAEASAYRGLAGYIARMANQGEPVIESVEVSQNGHHQD